MNTGTRLGLYGAGLAVAFGTAFVAADAVVPESTVKRWTEEAKGHDMSTDEPATGTHGGHTSKASPDAQAERSGEPMVGGVTSAQGGYVLSPITAPARPGESGRLTFQVVDGQGVAETDFAVEHGKELHLIVVRNDGTQFRHVHPKMTDDGTWSIPWEWAAAGTYRVYADFVPGAQGSQPVTLTRSVDVAGRFLPTSRTLSGTASVNGFTVDVTGDLIAGSSSELAFTVSRAGKPVTDLQPYLGAFGHLVALRDGDLAYLHVHPEGAEPSTGDLSGPEIQFVAEAPTPGRYLLYLDFRIDGQVHSAPFVLEARTTDATTESPSEQDGHSTTDSDVRSGDGHKH